MARAKMCFLQLTIPITIVSLITACATMSTELTMRQPDLDAWVGVSVEALDTHVFFKKVPMFRTKTENGTEIRNYAFGYSFEQCFINAGASKTGDFVNGNNFTQCSSSRITCNNIFYIKQKKVLEYAPTGRCDTDERTQPQVRQLRLNS